MNTGNIKNYPYQHIFERDKFTCQYCGWNGAESFEKWFVANLSIDHIEPVHAGGKDEPSNLVVACHSCNLYKGKQICHSFEEAKEFVQKKREEARNWFAKHVSIK